MKDSQVEPLRKTDDSEHEWPRDFDIRAEFAEQQELLSATFMTALTPPQSSGPNSDE